MNFPQSQFTSFFHRLRITDILVHGFSLLILVPQTWQTLQALLGLSVQTGRGGPYGMLLHITGEGSERLLIASLICTPLYIIFGWNSALRYRKALGLYAFWGLALHVVAQFGRHGINLDALVGNLGLVLGTIATVIMVALWVTSNNWSMKVMGKMWKNLHYAVYAVAILTELHVLFIEWPRINGHGIIFGIVMGVLLLIRLPTVRRFFVQRRAASAIIAPAQ